MLQSVKHDVLLLLYLRLLQLSLQQLGHVLIRLLVLLDLQFKQSLPPIDHGERIRHIVAILKLNDFVSVSCVVVVGDEVVARREQAREERPNRANNTARRKRKSGDRKDDNRVVELA